MRKYCAKVNCKRKYWVKVNFKRKYRVKVNFKRKYRVKVDFERILKEREMLHEKVQMWASNVTANNIYMISSISSKHSNFYILLSIVWNIISWIFQCLSLDTSSYTGPVLNLMVTFVIVIPDIYDYWGHQRPSSCLSWSQRNLSLF